MKGFFIEAELGHVTLAKSNAVVDAYLKYQTLMAVCTNAYALSVASTNSTPWLSASNMLWQSQGALLSLLNAK